MALGSNHFFGARNFEQVQIRWAPSTWHRVIVVAKGRNVQNFEILSWFDARIIPRGVPLLRWAAACGSTNIGLIPHGLCGGPQDLMQERASRHVTWVKIAARQDVHLTSWEVDILWQKELALGIQGWHWLVTWGAFLVETLGDSFVLDRISTCIAACNIGVVSPWLALSMWVQLPGHLSLWFVYFATPYSCHVVRCGKARQSASIKGTLFEWHWRVHIQDRALMQAVFGATERSFSRSRLWKSTKLLDDKLKTYLAHFGEPLIALSYEWV